MVANIGICTLSLDLASDGAPPSEFRLFRAGANETQKGTFYLTAQSLAAVLDAYREAGARVMIDLEHLSIDRECNSYDPDARGWCDLEDRGGELWAVNVTWTPDGAERLTQKKQGYVSPTFFHTEKGEITEIINVALCGMPATLQPQQLVSLGRRAPAREKNSKALPLALLAALVTRKGTSLTMNAEQAKAAMAAIEAGDTEKAMSLLKEFLASAVAGDSPEMPEAPEGDALSDAADPEPDEDTKAALAAVSALTKMTGKSGAGEAVAAVQAILSRVEKIEADNAVIELSQRQELVAKLVKLRAETPATAWEGEPEKRKPVGRLMNEPIADMRSRVSNLEKAYPTTSRGPVSPPSSGGSAETLPDGRVKGDATKLSDREKRECKRLGRDLQEFADAKANAVRRTVGAA